MKNDQFSTASGGEVIHSHLVYFIVPLPEPLGLPDKYLISCGSPTSREQYLKAQMAGRPMPPPWHRAASVVFHRYTSSSSSSQEINHLFELADQVLPKPANTMASDTGDQDGTAEVDEEVPKSQRTYAEIAVACDLTDEAEQQISDTFDAGIGFLRQFQRAYYLVRRAPIRLASRETMPFAVPFGVRRLVDEQGQVLPFAVPLSLYILNMNLRQDVRDEDLSDQELDQFQVALQQQSYRGFITDYMEFVRETQVALSLEGSYRSVALFAATSCEVLLDNLLAHMLWEEALRPEEAAAIFDSGKSGITARVKKHYHSRLGGQWSVDEPGAIHDWFKQVASLRNRVVHSGYDPSFTEAAAASQAASALATSLGDLLASNTETYPRTALILPGKPGIQRRGKWHERLDELHSDASEVNWVSTFASWRTAMQRCRSDSPSYVVPTSRGAWVYAVLHLDGNVRWVVRDPRAGYAALVDRTAVQGMTPAMQASLDASQRGLVEHGLTEVTSTPFNNLVAPEPNPDEWRPEYRLLPLLGVMVNGNDLDD
jgi:hypothetical protein